MCDEKDEYEAYLLHSRHYCNLIKQWDTAHRHGKLLNLSIDWPNVNGGWDWAAKRGVADSGVAQLSLEYLRYGINHLEAYKLAGNTPNQEVLARIEAALKAARLMGSKLGVALALSCKARAVQKRPPDHLDALFLYQEALAIRERELGPAHLEVADSLLLLGEFYLFLAECKTPWRYLKLAEQLFQRALAIREKLLGEWDPDVGECLSHLGRVFHARGRHGEAKVLYERELAIGERKKNDSLIVSTLRRLVFVSYSLGEYARVDSLRRRAHSMDFDYVRFSEAAFNISHRNGLDAQQEVDYPVAEVNFQSAIDEAVFVYGIDSSELAMCLSSLATLYKHWGRYAEAESLFQRVLAYRERVIDGDLLYVNRTLNDLAGLYFLQKRYDKAKLFYQRAAEVGQESALIHRAKVTCGVMELQFRNNTEGRFPQFSFIAQFTLAIGEKFLGSPRVERGRALLGLIDAYCAEAIQTLVPRKTFIIQEPQRRSYGYSTAPKHDGRTSITAYILTITLVLFVGRMYVGGFIGLIAAFLSIWLERMPKKRIPTPWGSPEDEWEDETTSELARKCAASVHLEND